MKQRFTILDIRAIVNELKGCILNKFIQNVYSTTQRVFYFKLSSKDVLLVEPGSRIHLTQNYDTEISHFAKKLREKTKHAKILDVYQYGYDRVVVLVISKYKIIFEFFSIGNIIILDEEDIIVEIHRPVPNLQMMKGSKYIFNKVEIDFTFEEFQRSGLEMFPFEKEYISCIENRMLSEIKKDFGCDLKNDFQADTENDKTIDLKNDCCCLKTNGINQNEKFDAKNDNEKMNSENEKFDSINQNSDIYKKNELKIDFFKKDFFKNQVEKIFEKLKKEVSEIGFFGEVKLKSKKPNEIFAFKTENLKFFEVKSIIESSKIEKDKNNTDQTNDSYLNNSLIDQFNKTFPSDKNFETSNKNSENSNKNSETSNKNSETLNISQNSTYKITLFNSDQIYEQIKNFNFLHFPTLNQAAEFFFENKIKKTNSKINKKQIPKEERIRIAQEGYITDLELQAEGIQINIDFLEKNREFITKILEVFKSVFENKMSWQTFDHFYQKELENGNELAKAIKKYDLKEKKVIIELEDNDDSDSNESNMKNTENTKAIQLNISDFNSNIQNLYKLKKKAREKSKKTKVAISNFTPKETHMKVAVQTRVPYWFEKFNYFISSEGIVILGGKNAQENEILVKKYMESTDVYMHCDVQGASSVICKMKSTNFEESITLTEASYMALCMSKCWDQGIIKDVFYVNPDQVSKTAPSGEFISKGGFMIKGKKNFLYPYKLEYAVGIIFVTSNNVNSKKKSFNDKNSNDNGIENNTHSSADNSIFKNMTPNIESVSQILHAMPVSGPWSVLQKYKYSVRIVPGNEKKQKIAQNIINQFIEISLGSSEEAFIRKIGVQEYINVIPGKSRIALKIHK